MRELYTDLVAAACEIENTWLAGNYDTDLFFECVLKHLTELDFSDLATVDAQMEVLRLPEVKALQTLSTFSNLYVKLFDNGRFWIEILNWDDLHVNAHDHDFSGVQFQLLGSALSIKHDFSIIERHGAFYAGQTSIRSGHLWEEGSNSIVRHGNIDPHTVLHLGSPSTSLIVRTHPTRRYGSQKNYFSDCAGHYDVNTIPMRKNLTALRLLGKRDCSSFSRQLTRLLKEQSLAENLFMLVNLDDICFEDEQSSEIVLEYGSKGRNEGMLVKSVLKKNCSSFFTNIAQKYAHLGFDERLAINTLSACYSIEDFRRLEKDISDQRPASNLSRAVEVFAANIDDRDRKGLLKRLGVMGLEDVLKPRVAA
ncbi:hypothetical protein [Tateyamaria sp.]|uniref:hypothetical protein n=1 Tax=Tateyamaria sp. TaxID=1929288 RepID=UPI0032A0EE80